MRFILIAVFSIFLLSLAPFGCGGEAPTGGDEPPNPSTANPPAADLNSTTPVNWLESSTVDLNAVYLKVTGKSISGKSWSLVSVPEGDFGAIISTDVASGKPVLKGGRVGTYQLKVTGVEGAAAAAEELVTVKIVNFLSMYVQGSSKDGDWRFLDLQDPSGERKLIADLDPNFWNYSYIGLSVDKKTAVFQTFPNYFGGVQDKRRLIQVNLSTLKATVLDEGNSFSPLQITADNYLIYINEENKLLKRSLLDTSVTDLYDLDGSLLAFHANGPRLIVSKNGTPQLVDLGTPANNKALPSGYHYQFSMQGDRFLYDSTSYYSSNSSKCIMGKNDIYTMAVSSNTPKKVISEALGASPLTFSGAGGYFLYFKQTTSGAPCKLYSVAWDGTLPEYDTGLTDRGVEFYEIQVSGMTNLYYAVEGDKYILVLLSSSINPAIVGFQKFPIQSGIAAVGLNNETSNFSGYDNVRLYSVGADYLYKNYWNSDWKTVSINGGPATRVSEMVGGCSPAGDDLNLWICPSSASYRTSGNLPYIFDGSEFKHITLLQDWNWDFSPDGDAVITSISQLNEKGAAVMRYFRITLDKPEEQNLLWETDAYPVYFILQGRYFLFEKAKSSDQWALFDIASGKERDLGEIKEPYNSPSPAGERLLFYSTSLKSISLVPVADGSKITWSGTSPVWSPDGRYLIYRQAEGDNSYFAKSLQNPAKADSKLPYAFNTSDYFSGAQGFYEVEDGKIRFVSLESGQANDVLDLKTLSANWGDDFLLLGTSDKNGAVYFAMGPSIFSLKIGGDFALQSLGTLEGAKKISDNMGLSFDEARLYLKVTEDTAQKLYEVPLLSGDQKSIASFYTSGKGISCQQGCSFQPNSVVKTFGEEDKTLALIPVSPPHFEPLYKEDPNQKVLAFSYSGKGFYQIFLDAPKAQKGLRYLQIGTDKVSDLKNLLNLEVDYIWWNNPVLY